LWYYHKYILYRNLILVDITHPKKIKMNINMYYFVR